MKTIGLVFLYDRSEGAPDDISKKFGGSEGYFASISENLVKEGLITLPELKEIMDSQKIYWGGIKENFKAISDDPDSIGEVSFHVFNGQTGIESCEEIKSLVYDEKAPWGFKLLACVVYQ